MLRRICCRRPSSSCRMKKTAHLLRWTIDDKVITQVKKCVWDRKGTRCVIMELMAQAAVIVCLVCVLNRSPEGTCW